VTLCATNWTACWKTSRDGPGDGPGHADGTRYVDWAEGERVLNEIIYECQQSLKAIEHAKIDQEARSWARGMGYKDEGS